jgi:hypothetical protein
MSTVVEEFVGVLGIKADPASFDAAEKRLQGIGSTVKNLAVGFGALFAGSQIIGKFKEAVNEADALGDSAARIGIATSSLQALGYAADQNASSLEEVQQGLQFLQRNSQAAASGSKEMAKAFKSVGISGKELKDGLPTEEVLLRVADAMQKTTNPAKRTALAVQLLGRSGDRLIPFLSKGRQGLEDLFAEFEKSGAGFTDDFIEKAQETNDALGRMHFQLQGLTSQVGSTVLPVFNNLLTKMIEWARAIGDLLKGSEYLRSALIITAAAFVAWGAASLFASAAARQKFGLLATMALLTAALDEIAVALKGGRTLIGTWIDKWAGLGTVDSLVRSIGQGLKEIHKFGYFGGIKTAINDFRDLSADARNREARIEDLKAKLAAEKDPDKKQVIVHDLIKQLNYSRDVAEAQLGETPRTTQRGLGAAIEQVRPGEATASAVNEGAFNTLFGGEGIATTNSKGQTVYQTVNQNTTVNQTNKSEASPREIARHTKEAVEQANREHARQLKASTARKKPSAQNPGYGGDASIDGLDK